MTLNEERIYYTRNQEYKYKRLDLSTLKLIYLFLKGPTIKEGKKQSIYCGEKTATHLNDKRYYLYIHNISEKKTIKQTEK